jgi:hypothetical protein
LHREAREILAPVPFKIALCGHDRDVLAGQPNRYGSADAPARLPIRRNVHDDAILLLAELFQVLLSRSSRSGDVGSEARREA